MTTTKHNVLTGQHRDVLSRVSCPDALLAFDFDGTLAPIVAHPPDAAMRESTRVRLTAIALRRRVAVISGRALADVAPRLQGIATVAIVGNHGIEPSPQMASARKTVEGWLPLLNAEVAHLAGVVIEDKGQSLAVHYRHSPSPDEARSTIDKTVQRLGEGARRVEGLHVVNVVPAGAPTKGDAILRLRDQMAATAVFYVGDEETDEDAFAVIDDDRSIGIRVGKVAHSRARYYVERQEDIDELLDLLLQSIERFDAAALADVDHAVPSTQIDSPRP